MTRLAILSDIHGNLPALEAVIADMRRFNPDHVIVAGDLINGVPFDPEVMQAVVSRGWTAIRGNHELYLLDYATERERPGMRRSPSPAWLDRNLREWVPAIATMPDSVTLRYRDAPLTRVMHGLPADPFDAIYPTTPEDVAAGWLQGVEETVYVCGHIHLPLERQVGRWRVLNAASVGALADGTGEAAYLLLDAAGDRWEPHLRRVPYDFERVERAFRAYDLDRILGVEGMLKCEQVRRARPTLPPFEAWLRRHYPGEGWSYERAVEFLALPLEAIWDILEPAYRLNPGIALPAPVAAKKVR